MKRKNQPNQIAIFIYFKLNFSFINLLNSIRYNLKTLLGLFGFCFNCFHLL